MTDQSTFIQSCTSPGRLFPSSNVFCFNQLAWATPFFIGLSCTFFDRGPMQKLSFNIKYMMTWTPIVYFFALMLILLICGVLGYAIAVYVLNGLIMWYIGWFFLIIGFFTVVTLCLRKTHHLHMHHYTIGMILIAMFGY